MAVTTILLAAGTSIRMGQPKLLLPHPAGGTWGSQLVAQFAQRGPVIVVVNPDTFPLWSPLCPDTAAIVLNPHPEWGLFSSVVKALSEHPATTPVYLHPVDCPLWEIRVLEVLEALAELTPESHGWWAPTCHGVRGHPSLLSAFAAQEVAKEAPTAILRDVLARHECVEVPCESEQVLWNMNCPEDAAKLWEHLPPTHLSERKE